MTIKNRNSKSEAEVTGPIRLAFQKLGAILFRNNVGKLRDNFGRWVTFGLCPGSTDFVGWYPYVVQPKDVGRKIAVFTAPELKRPNGGKVTEDQSNFIDRVIEDGGIAGVVRSEDDAQRLIEEFNNRSLTK